VWNRPDFRLISSKFPQVPRFTRNQIYSLGLESYLLRSLLLLIILDAFSSVPVIRLSRIRWYMCSPISTHVTIDEQQAHISSIFVLLWLSHPIRKLSFVSYSCCLINVSFFSELPYTDASSCYQ